MAWVVGHARDPPPSCPPPPRHAGHRHRGPGSPEPPPSPPYRPPPAILQAWRRERPRHLPRPPRRHAFNQDVSRLPVDPRSDAYVASIGAAEHLHADFGSNPSYGIPYTVVGAHQPRVPITFTAYGDQSDPGPYPVPANAPVEGGSDHHVLVVQNGTCRLYELYAAQRAGLGWDAGSGAVFDLRSDRLRPDTQTSADAAGLPISPGSSATTRRAPATSTTPCASRSPARRRRSCIRPRTSPRTPPTPAGRPWGCGCG